MTTGELWVAHPLFPWLMIILSWWVLCSTAVMVRNWVRLRRLERHNKLLQKMLVEGVESVARRTTAIENRILKPIPSEEECPSELRSEEAGIRIAEQSAAAVEETEENGDYVATRECEDQKRARVGST